MNLNVKVVKLLRGAEWHPTPGQWHLVQKIGGVCYWRGEAEGVDLEHLALLGISPGCRGHLLASKLDSAELRMMSFETGMLSGVLTLPELRCLRRLEELRDNKSMLWLGNHDFAVRFLRVTERVGLGNASDRVARLGLIIDLLEPATREAGKPGLGDLEGPMARLERVLRGYSEVALVRLSIGELAKAIHCSERHTSRLLRVCLGESLRERQRRLRMKHACELLAQSDAKILEVAAESGYPSVGLFNAVFKRQFGSTPSRYRRQAAARQAGDRGASPAPRSTKEAAASSQGSAVRPNTLRPQATAA